MRDHQAHAEGFEFRILRHETGWHLQWLDTCGSAHHRRYSCGPSWFNTLSEAHAAAERWLADPNGSPWN